ncbi:hypothetical protein BDN72DRAFT_845886 [Pluteus cervinus]|uniref:Uncharacterized protein n=1 Tax=Pluteus cervinus TaxID=181527 RepID=A0ACD3AH77_9AGAR|nr:hypothetical protein BDN72DRAFT_845886 [Pluteus cervinus]
METRPAHSLLSAQNLQTAGIYDWQQWERLRTDMLEALEKLNFQGDSGQLAASKVFTEAPNPWLSISSLGLVGLPFSERDAKNLVASFNQGPSIHYMRVNNTWKVDSSALSLQNPEWNRYLNNVILKFITDQLDVNQASKPPRLELDKLLVCEVGSNFVSDQGPGVGKPPGTYATVVISLPSTYTGGAIRVLQGGQSKVLDVSSKPFFLGVSFWFTDSQHTVEPVQSGYRLALTYHLIHTSAVVPIPTPPIVSDALDQVGDVLRKWEQGSYTAHSGVLASLLPHHKSPFFLHNQGLKGLDDSDIRNLRRLQSVAEDLGYQIYMGDLECKVVGYTSDYGGSDDPSVDADEDDVFMQITGLVDLNGTRLPGIPPDGLKIDEADLLQGTFFRRVKPDDSHRGGRHVTYTYYRRAFVIFHNIYAQKLMLELRGFSYAISELTKVVPSCLAPKDLSLADAALLKMGAGYELTQRISQMFDLALNWEDVALWKKVSKKAQRPSDLQENDLLAALKTFGFEAVIPVIEGKINGTSKFGEKIGFIDTISANLGADDSRPNWRSEHHLKALASVEHLHEEDIPQVMSLARMHGLKKIMDRLLPTLQHNGWYQRYYQVLTRKLHEAATSCADDSEEWERFANMFLDITTKSWAKNGWGHMNDRKLEDALELIDLCLSLGRPVASQSVLNVIAPKENAYDMWNEYLRLIPWTPQLCDLLSRFGLSIASPPFDDLARHIVGSYARDILGAPEKPVGSRRAIKIEKVGCGCQHCEALDAFIVSSQEQVKLRVPETSYGHLARHISRAAHILGSPSTSFQGRFRTLEFSKAPPVLVACRETNRVSDAKAIVEGLGGAAVISQLMGDRFVDVRRTLDHREPFEWPRDYLTQAWSSTSAQTPSVSQTPHVVSFSDKAGMI